jgi:hypothetical protein
MLFPRSKHFGAFPILRQQNIAYETCLNDGEGTDTKTNKS